MWIAVLWPLSARAQGGLQIPLQFDFLNPGARSLALGSAFAGLADDATAAFTNPAGLLILRNPEISIDVRGRRLESPFLKGGRLSGPLSNMGIDTIAGPVYEDSIDASTGLSYVSFVYPRGDWAVAGYRHEFVRVDQSFEANGVFQEVFSRELALRAARNISITAYGAAGAFRIRPKVRVGGGVALYTFDLSGQFNRFSFGPEGFFEPPTFDPAQQRTRAEQSGDRSALGFNIGSLITLRQSTGATARGPELVQLGVVYRKTPSFAFDAFEGGIGRPVEKDGVFRAPDAFAAGLAVRFTGNLMVTSEVTWVQYESLLDGYVSSQAGAADPANYTLNNGVELHGGVEYVFDAPASPAVRIGVWRDPDHALRYEAPANPSIDDERLAAYLPPRGPQTHFTIGGGMSLTDRLEINVGADLAKPGRQVSVSAVVRFIR